MLSGENIIGWVSDKYLEFEELSPIEKILQVYQYRMMVDWEATSDFKGEVIVVRNLAKGEIVKGTNTTATHIHLVGGGFVPKTAVEPIDKDE